MADRRDSEYLVLDIETVPDSTRWTPPDRPPGVDPPFPPTWAHRVIMIGCLWLDSAYRLKRLGVIGDGHPTAPPDVTDPAPDPAADRERSLLAELSGFVERAGPVLVTYNGRSFDLPVIALRSLCHGVPLAWYYREPALRHRYSDDGHLDLCDWLADHGATRSGSLDAVTRLIGLPGKSGVDGSKVEGLYRDGDLASIEGYCLNDVAQTALLFLRFQLLRGILAAADYRAAATALLEALRGEPRLGTLLTAIDEGRLLAASDPGPGW